MEQIQDDTRVMSLVKLALALPPEERASYLDNACAGNPQLLDQVQNYVQAEERMKGFLLEPLYTPPTLPEYRFQPDELLDGRFRIVREVAKGGMGVVYEAVDEKLSRRIALKSARAGYHQRLPPEVRHASDVGHPNVCKIFEIHSTSTPAGRIEFITMEFLDGETMADKLAREKFEEGDAWLIARQLCSGLAEAHRSGILHRDLKPGNVILCRDKDGSPRAVITDFGLAVQASDVRELEGGTPSYMAPELWRGSNGSSASDVFSLGVMLYEMVTGLKPFPALSKENLTFPPPIAPSKVVKNLPHRWDRAILPCLRENPEERCSAQDVLDVLNRTPFYRKPAVLVAIAACLLIAVLAAPKIYEWFKPAPYSMVVLPVDAPGDLAQRGEGIRQNVAGRIRKIQPWFKPTLSVISPAKGVTTPEQAAQTGATHALQVELRPEGDGVLVKGYIVDLKDPKSALGRDPDYTAHFSNDNLDDLATGLTGRVAFALNVSRTVKPQTVNQAAGAAYNRGHDFLDSESNDFASAIREFQEAARLDPHSPLPPAGLAEAYGREFNATKAKTSMDTAKAWLQKAEALDADSPDVRLASGLLYEFQKNYAMAHRDFARVKMIQPGNITAWLRSAVSYELESSADKATREYTLAMATKDYQHAIALEPDNYQPYIYLGSLYFNRGMYSEARDQYYKAHQLAPQSAGISASLAATYIALGKNKEAEAVYDQLPPGPATALAWNNLGAKFAFDKNDAEAMRYYQKAIQQDPGSIIYLKNLGDSQRRMKDIVHAKANYESGLRLAKCDTGANRNSASALAYCAYFEARLNKQKDSRRDMNAAMDLAGVDDQVILLAVETYEALGDRKEAGEAASHASPQTLDLMKRHPDLQDSEFIKFLQQRTRQ